MYNGCYRFQDALPTKRRLVSDYKYFIRIRRYMSLRNCVCKKCISAIRRRRYEPWPTCCRFNTDITISTVCTLFIQTSFRLIVQLQTIWLPVLCHPLPGSLDSVTPAGEILRADNRAVIWSPEDGRLTFEWWVIVVKCDSPRQSPKSNNLIITNYYKRVNRQCRRVQENR